MRMVVVNPKKPCQFFFKAVSILQNSKTGIPLSAALCIFPKIQSHLYIFYPYQLGIFALQYLRLTAKQIFSQNR
jgi:hypothetical protein